MFGGLDLHVSIIQVSKQSVMGQEKAVYEAVTKAVRCSYDPVCIQTKSQGLGGTNASSCHACTFVSETSCEENNQLLNRTTVIGDIINNQQGYFKNLLKD